MKKAFENVVVDYIKGENFLPYSLSVSTIDENGSYKTLSVDDFPSSPAKTPYGQTRKHTNMRCTYGND